MINPKVTHLLLTLTTLYITGCTFWHKNHKVELDFIPDQYANIKSDEVQVLPLVNVEWWLTFEDTLLNRFMNSAFESNLNLAQAIARLDQSKARYAGSRSSLFPSIGANLGYQNSDITDAFESKIPNQSDEMYNMNFSAAYELDFWGRLSATRQASYADLLASKEDLRSFRLIFSAQLARNYFRIIELHQQVRLIDNTIVSMTDYYDLVSSRYSAGLVSSLEVYQAESNLAKTQARKHKVEIAYLMAQNTFFTLLGEYPKSDKVFETMQLNSPGYQITTGVPSDILKQRPDVHSAFLRMQAADKRWAAAVADRFPSFRLTTQGGVQNSDLSQTLDPNNLIWSAIGSVALPLFEGGRRKAAADLSAAVYRELSNRYKSVVLNSFREVEDALITIEKQEKYLEELEHQVRATENSLRVATDRYLRGLSQYLVLVTAQTAYFNAETNMISARREMMDAYISLFLSLGGNWTDESLSDISINQHPQSGKP